MKGRCTTQSVVDAIRKALSDGHVVDIEGFGTFRPAANGFEFVAESRPRVFLAYVQEDLAAVRRLYVDLKKAGYQPWLDRENLLPGQNWPRAIQRAIEVADFFIPCFSRRSVQKRGGFQSELRFALDCTSKLPLDDIFLIPVRLEECPVPERIHKQLHHVDLFPSWDEGVGRVQRAIERELARRRKAKLPLAG